MEDWKGTGRLGSTHPSVLPSFHSSLLLVILFCSVFAFRAEAEDVYSLFGKLFLSGRVEYDFTNRRNFLADTEEERVRQDDFDFDRLFRRGFHSVMVIEETAGSVKNILSLGEVPTTFTKFTFDQIDLSGVRWEVRSNHTDWTILMVPGLLNRLNGQEGADWKVRVSVYARSQSSAIHNWGFLGTFERCLCGRWILETNFTNYGVKAEVAVTPKSALQKELRFTLSMQRQRFSKLSKPLATRFFRRKPFASVRGSMPPVLSAITMTKTATPITHFLIRLH